MSKLSRAYKFILVSGYDEWPSSFDAPLLMLPFLHCQVIWMISICLAVPQVSFQRLLSRLIKLTSDLPLNLQTLFTLHYDDIYRICVPKQDYNHLFVVSTFLLFVIPMSIITILYVLIGLQLRKSKIVQRGAVNGSSVRLKVTDWKLCEV
jgi:hypothetical protein